MIKKYIRWIIFGLIASILLLLIVLVGANKKLRRQISLLLQEQLIKTKIKDLQDQAIIVKHRASNNEVSAEKMEEAANKINGEILKQKQKLEKDMVIRGLSANEISNRFNNLRI